MVILFQCNWILKAVSLGVNHMKPLNWNKLKLQGRPSIHNSEQVKIDSMINDFEDLGLDFYKAGNNSFHQKHFSY